MSNIGSKILFLFCFFRESKSSPTKTPTPTKEKIPTVMSKEEENMQTEDAGTPSSEASASASWGGWFSNTFVQAREKSSEMLNYLKQDLSEFSETVQEAGREIKDKLKLEDTMKTAVNVVGTRANVVLEQMSTIFGIGPDDEDEELVMGQPTPRTRVRVSDTL